MKIHLIAAPVLTGGMQAFLDNRLESWQRDSRASDAELLVEAAGRVCYMSFGERQFRKRNDDYIANIVAQGHESVLEHATFTLLADGISRALSHQLVRHRTGFAYSQLSQQYHDDSDAVFVEPAELDAHPGAQRMWHAATATALKAYRTLLAEAKGLGEGTLDQKESARLLRSVARSVLPNATATSLMVTGNARAWRHLLAVRGDIAGDLEMRSYCVQVLHVLAETAPALFADFRVERDAIGELVQQKTPAAT